MPDEDFDINTYVYPTQDIDYSSGGYDSDFNYGNFGGGDLGVILNPDGTLSGGSGIGAVTGTSSAPDSSVVKALKKFFSGESSAGTYAGAGVGLLGLLDAYQKNKQRKANQVTQTPLNLNKYKYLPSTTNKPAPRAYGSGAVGQQYAAPQPVLAAEGGLMAKGGSTNYLRGKTDGMADKLNTSIEGVQPAKLSHGEFVVPADVVAHLGNGNSEAGADVLYKMLARVRHARTGNKKQGKKINPNKFMPGGIASLNNYAAGGQVAFETGGTAKVTGAGTVTSSLSPYAQEYVGGMLEKGAALADKPYEAYGGQLTAGTSPLQQQAFTAASNLSIPATVGQGSDMVRSAGNALGNLSYNAAPVSSTYNAPQGYTAGQVGNLYTGTSPYAASNIGIDQFDTANMQRYMNPYMQMALDPQIAEARRQSEITQMGNASKLAQAGAFGGSRGALMQSEAQRNLGTNLANITGQGYNTAFDKALSAFNTQQGLGLQAQQANENSRQFGANQALSNAQNAAQYGLAGFNANEQARQTQGSQALANAQNAAQYGQSAQALNAQQQQFGANLGLSGLQGQLNAGSTLGNLGLQENQAGLANLNAQLGAGSTQSAIEQAALDAERGQFQESQMYPYKQLQFQQSLLTGLPISAQTATGDGSMFSDLAAGIGSILNTQKAVDAATKPG